jgi:hypothetical protein
VFSSIAQPGPVPQRLSSVSSRRPRRLGRFLALAVIVSALAPTILGLSAAISGASAFHSASYQTTAKYALYCPGSPAPC